MARFQVYRSIQINAAPERVFQAVADFGTWTTWSPWLCAEPDATVNVSEDPSSVGSMYSWSGEIVGEGEIEHRQLQPGRLIEDEIRFVRPFRSKSDVSFELEPAEGGTKITWHMHGSLPWFLFWMRPQMKTIIGMDYDRGLKMLKEWIETDQILSNTKIVGVNSVGPLQMAGVRTQCTLDEIGPSMEAIFAQATQNLSDRKLPTDGEKISVYHDFNLKTGVFDYTGGFIIPQSNDFDTGDLSRWSVSETSALCVEHVGNYTHLGNAWSAANQYARYKKLKQSKAGAFEIYKNDPQDTAPADLRTVISLPLK